MDGPTVDVHPMARQIVDGLASAPTSPTKIAVIGGIGTGKSAILGTIRTHLRDAGLEVLTRIPRNGETVTDAIVVDDAHLLSTADLRALAEYVARPQATVVIAAEPHQYNSALRDLTRAIENEDAAVLLGPVSPAELSNYASTVGGRPTAPYDSELLRSLLAATAGFPFLVKSALRSSEPTEGRSSATTFSSAVKFALIERLRGLDEQLLDALLIGSLSPELGTADVAAALSMPSADAHTLVDRARASGLIAPSLPPRFLLSVHGAVTQIVGAARHHELETQLLTTQIGLETLTTDLALRLAEHGTRDDRLARVLERQARSASGEPGRVARLYRAAVSAGAGGSGGGLDTRLADALALTGDCTTAAAIADDLLGSDNPAQRAAAVRIAASVAAHDGNATQAGELFRWLGPHPDAFVTACAVIALLGCGDVAAARRAVSAENAGPPTSTASAARSLAEGLMLTLDQPFPVAIARLGQSITTDRSPGVGPDTAAALVTLTAMHGGDPVRARNVIGRAVRASLAVGDGPSPAPFAVNRHRLLLGWARMQDGQLSAAASDAVAVISSVGAELHRRDALWASALQTGIARRAGDTGAVQKYWHSAMEMLAECTVDLFSLMPLGELWVAAARLRQESRLQHTLDEAFALLESLGNPVLWAVPLHWAGVHAGILANSPDAVAPHGQALTAASRAGGPQSAFALALANAGRSWLRVLANHVDIDEVTLAARGLSQFGLTWDATRLASQAALQTPDGRVSGAMLQLARDLKQTLSVEDDPETTGSNAGMGSNAGVGIAEPRESRHGPPRPSSSRLSDREREVAELLLLGLPYRDIGSQLFISAKTVEHHVARIRRRIGAESRSEMLSMLRALVASQRTDS